LGLLVLLLHLV
jgi:hypothetical protein